MKPLPIVTIDYLNSVYRIDDQDLIGCTGYTIRKTGEGPAEITLRVFGESSIHGFLLKWQPDVLVCEKCGQVIGQVVGPCTVTCGCGKTYDCGERG